MENIIYFKMPENIEENLAGLKIQQRAAVINAIKYLADPLPDKKYFLIQGAAGTGKTTCIRHAILHIPKHKVIAAAPSHPAKTILADSLGKGYNVVTIANLMGKKLSSSDSKDKKLIDIDNKRGKPIAYYDVIIIDEASMVLDWVSKDILNNSHGKKVLVLGDYFQLLPVGQEKENLFFDKMSEELTEPIRFTGPIFTLSMLIREELNNIRDGDVPRINIITEETGRISNIDSNGSGYIFLNNLSHLLRTYIRRYKEGDSHKETRILAYRNKTIDFLNKNIRYRLYGKNPKQFESGEVVISNGGFKALQAHGKSVSIRNGAVFQVSNSEEVTGPYNIECVKISLHEMPYMDNIYVVAKKGRRAYKKKLREKEKAAEENGFLWRDFHAFIDSFASFDYGYSSTIHKCLPLNSRILMSDYTLKELKDVQIGDTVISGNGKKEVVVNKSEKKNKKTISFNSGLISSSLEHRFRIIRGNSFHRWVKAKDIKKGDLICKATFQNKSQPPLPRHKAAALLHRLSFYKLTPKYLQMVLDYNYTYVEIIDIKHSKEQIMQDLEIENSHSFIANGCVCHNSQGSSITNTFIMEEDLMDIKPITYKSKFHVLYTAVTRSSFRVYIFNKKSVTDNSQLNLEYLKIKPNG